MNNEMIPFEECPVGMFVSGGGELCLKTEYGLEAYIVSSGERFWGGAKNSDQLGRVMVRPAEVETVRHGEWMWDGNRGTVCSCCKKTIPSVSYYSWDDELAEEEIDETPFCPNCGVRMDGGAGV